MCVEAPDDPPDGQADRRLRLLIDAGTVLNASPSSDAALRDLARLACEHFADVCIVDLRGFEGRALRLAAIAGKPDIPLDGFRLGADGAAEPRVTLSVAMDVVEMGRSVLAPTVEGGFLRRFGGLSGAAATLRRAGIHSLASAPIIDGRMVHGAITLLRGSGDTRPFAPADLEVAEDLGRRAGASYGSRRLFQRERRIAMRLQEAMLPKALPRHPKARLDAVYLPGATELTVGGDWYDAFVIEDGRLVMTIGDVLGRGLDAAITMSRLRQAMQSVAFLHADPAAMLAAADCTIRLNEPDLFATAIAAVYDPELRRLRFASAGHPGPFERRADGTVLEHSRSGLPLGLRDDEETIVESIDAPAGSTFVFFTDGLVEATRDLALGYERVRAALRRLPLIAARPAQRIADAVLTEVAHDDVCVLTLDTDGGIDSVPRLTTPLR